MSSTPEVLNEPRVERFTVASTVAELIADSKQHPLIWVRDVVQEDGIHILHGAEESFKTMLTLQLHESLTVGKPFLLREVKGGLRTGIAELEMKARPFGSRLGKFFSDPAPDIRVLPANLRRNVLSGPAPKDRIRYIVNWAKSEGLDFLSIDSAVKLFPSGCDLSRPDVASEVFNQLQQLPTTWIIAHDRKQLPGPFGSQSGNAEIVGSGRFAQDPDVVHQLIRPDGRAPMVQFHWGKMRDGEKLDPMPLFFDRADFRLYPLHPYLHLLSSPSTGRELISQAHPRFGWKERTAREHLSTLAKVVDSSGVPCVREITTSKHETRYELVSVPVALLESP